MDNASQIDHGVSQSERLERVENDQLSIFFDSDYALTLAHVAQLEGRALGRLIEKQAPKVFVALASDEDLLSFLSSEKRHAVIDKVREISFKYQKLLLAGEVSAFNLIPAARELLTVIDAETSTRVLRYYFHFICPALTGRQLVLCHASINRALRALDRASLRAVFREDNGIVNQAIAGAGYGGEEKSSPAFRFLSSWLNSWAVLPLQPRVKDDFAFFRCLLHADGKLELDEEDWRGIFKNLAFAVDREVEGRMSDAGFALFRALVRGSRRLSFVFYLVSVHGRALKLLDEELRDWVLVQTLLGETPELCEKFRFRLDLAQIRESSDLEADELRDFFSTLTGKIRKDRERFELDWFEQAWEQLCSMLERRKSMDDWMASVDKKSSDLASSIAADSSEKVSVSRTDATIRVQIRAIAHAVAVAESSREAKRLVGESMPLLIDLGADRQVWRNCYRIGLSFNNTLSDELEWAKARFTGILEALESIAALRSENYEEAGSSLRGQSVYAAALSCQVLYSQLVGLGQSMAVPLLLFLREEISAARMSIENLSALVEQEAFHKIMALSSVHLSEEEALLSALNDELSIVRLWQSREHLAAEFSGSDKSSTERFSRLILLMFKLEPKLTARSEEEWQIWLAPEIRSLFDDGYPADSLVWSTLLERTEPYFPAPYRTNLRSFFRRILTASKSGNANENHRKMVQFRPLRYSIEPPEAGTSEPFLHLVEQFQKFLHSASAPAWIVQFADSLKAGGDEEAAWFSVYPSIKQDIEADGQPTVSLAFDRLIVNLNHELPAAAAGYWLETLAEGRALSQHLTIGMVWQRHSEALAHTVAPKMASTMQSKPDISKFVRDLDLLINNMGKAMANLPPALAAIELPRFWFQCTLPFLEFPSVAWRFMALALRDATSEFLPQDMTVSVTAWCNRFGLAAERLNSCQEFAKRTLQARGNLFAENSSDEQAWRALLAGLVVCSTFPESGRLPRRLQVQRLIEVTSPLRKISVDQWKQVSMALTRKFRNQLDPDLVPAFLNVQNDVADIMHNITSLNAAGNVHADTLFWIKGKTRSGLENRWRRFIAVASPSFGVSNDSMITVSQMNGWAMPEEGFRQSYTKSMELAFDKTLNIHPKDVKTGVIKRSAPEIPAEQLDSWRARLIGYVIGVAQEDDCCQRQCVFSLLRSSMGEWAYEAVLQLLEIVDYSTYQMLEKGEAHSKRRDVVADAWLSSTLTKSSEGFASSLVDRWQPFKGAQDKQTQHDRCKRDIGYLLSHMMYISSGIPGVEPLDKWYETHVLQFVSKESMEPFHELTNQLDKSMKENLPKSVYQDQRKMLQPLHKLLIRGNRDA